MSKKKKLSKPGNEEKRYFEGLGFETSYAVVRLAEVASADLIKAKAVTEHSLQLLVNHMQENGRMEHSLLLLWEPNADQNTALTSTNSNDSKYFIVDGFKRYRAATALGVSEWPAIILRQAGSVESIVKLLKRAAVTCASANKLVDYFTFTQLAEFYCSFIPNNKNLSSTKITDAAYDKLCSQVGAISISKEYFRKVITLWQEHFAELTRQYLKQLEQYLPPMTQIFSENFCVRYMTNPQLSDRNIQLQAAVKEVLDSLQAQLEVTDKKSVYAIEAKVESAVETLRDRVKKIYKNTLERTQLENIRSPTSRAQLMAVEPNNKPQSNAKTLWEKLDKINGQIDSEDSDAELLTINNQQTELQDDESGNNKNIKPGKQTMQLRGKRQRTEQQSDTDANPSKFKRARSSAGTSGEAVSLSQHLTSNSKQEANKSANSRSGDSSVCNNSQLLVSQQSNDSSQLSGQIDATYPFCSNGNKFKTTHVVDAAWEQYQNLLQSSSVDVQLFRDCVTPALELVSFWNYDSETNIFTDALQPTNCLVFINLVRSPHLARKVDTIRSWLGALPFLEDYTSDSQIRYNLRSYNINAQFASQINFLESTTTRTLYHDVAHWIAFSLKCTGIRRVVYLDSGDDVELAVEMAVRGVQTDLPNASHQASYHFCFQFWEHFFSKMIPPPTSVCRDFIPRVQLEDLFYLVMEMHQCFILPPNDQHTGVIIKRLRNAIMPSFNLQTAIVQLDHRKITSLPFEMLDQVLPEEAKSVNNFFLTTQSSASKMFTRITITANDNISIPQSSYHFCKLALNLSEQGLTHVIVWETSEQLQVLSAVKRLTKESAEAAGLKVITLYPGDLLMAKSNMNLILVAEVTDQLLLQWDLLPISYLFSFGHHWVFYSKAADPYSFEDIYFSNVEMIGKLSASNTLFRSIYYSMRDLHDRVDTAKNLPNIKSHQKLQSMGICAYPECEKQFSHFAIHCPTCKIFYCVYCDGAETHDQKHGLVFSAK